MRPSLARPTDVGRNENVIGAGVDTAQRIGAEARLQGCTAER